MSPSDEIAFVLTIQGVAMGTEFYKLSSGEKTLKIVMILRYSCGLLCLLEGGYAAYFQPLNLETNNKPNPRVTSD